jgi:hypothetical protein
MTTASIVSKVWSFCNPFLRKPKKAPKGRNIRTMGAVHREKTILPKEAPKGRNTQTMGAAHRNMQIAKALKGRYNTQLKN